MSIDLELAPKQKRLAGEPRCEPVVYPDVERAHAVRMAEVAKALSDPVRLQVVDVLRKHAGKVCVCELVPLFEISNSGTSSHTQTLPACFRSTSTTWRRTGSLSAFATSAMRTACARSTSG